MSRSESVARNSATPVVEMMPGVALRVFVSGHCGARGVTTASVTLAPGGVLPYHTHLFSEAITVLSGELNFEVEGRCYRLRPLDCIHIPANVPHTAGNVSKAECVCHAAFASESASRELVHATFKRVNIGDGVAPEGAPEHVSRIDRVEKYLLAPNAQFSDLFAARFGSRGICGGYGVFQPGASLPCHVHKYDESITIVSGAAVCEAAGNRYTLSGCDTASVPEGMPHRFLNVSDQPMAMIWVYAGDEPERTLVDAGYCTGVLKMKSGSK
jgi:putative monooxygenase